VAFSNVKIDSMMELRNTKGKNLHQAISKAQEISETIIQQNEVQYHKNSVSELNAYENMPMVRVNIHSKNYEDDQANQNIDDSQFKGKIFNSGKED